MKDGILKKYLWYGESEMKYHFKFTWAEGLQGELMV